jgi:hypothetical protein
LGKPTKNPFRKNLQKMIGKIEQSENTLKNCNDVKQKIIAGKRKKRKKEKN